MSIFKRAITFFTGKPKFVIKPEHRLKTAFTSNGRDYFQFDDDFNMPHDRFFCAMQFYNELQMKCDQEYLLAHCDAVNDLVNHKHGIQLSKIIQLNTQMKERVDFIVDADIALKLASVVFFDATENPYEYDFKYGQEKIERWKKEGVSSFFLQMPVKKLIGCGDILETDLNQYIQTASQMTKQHLSFLLSNLSEQSKKKEYYKTLESQKQKI